MIVPVPRKDFTPELTPSYYCLTWRVEVPTQQYLTKAREDKQLHMT
jgi:hypothetical protein